MTRHLLIGLAALAILTAACAGSENGNRHSPAPQSSPSAVMTSPSPPVSRTSVPGTIPPPQPNPNATPYPLINARNAGQNTIITDAGETLRVAPSKAGILYGYHPGERWVVTREDGSVIFAGEFVGEAQMYESAYGFVRLDDGAFLAYYFGLGPEWIIYRAEDVCELMGGSLNIPSAHVTDGVIQQEALLEAICGGLTMPDSGMCRNRMRGTIAVIAICLEKLGITQGIQIVP